MADQEIHEMISAYAAGCLDVDNFINFKEYLTSDGKLPYSELGELQNVIALLSVVGEIEQPPASLKAGVAKKLISLQDEIKAKLKAEKSAVPKEKSDKTKSFTETRITKESDFEIPEETPEKPVKEIKKEKIESVDSVFEKEEEKKVFYTEDVESKNKTKQQSKLGFYFSTTALVLIVISFYIIFSNQSTLDTRLEILNMNIKEAQAKSSEAESFIKEHKKLLEFFTYNNVSIANFDRPDDYSTATGKFFISFDKTLGLLMVNNLPELLPGEMYQLWLVSRGRSYPVISFIPSKNFSYIHVSELPRISKSEIDLFRITSEKKPNPDLPEGKTVLVGGFLK